MSGMTWKRLGPERARDLQGIRLLDSMIPSRDSAFRLRPCGDCGRELGVFLKEQKENENHPLWRVRCRVCGRETGGHRCMHDAQLEWNGVTAGRPGERRRK